MTAELAPLRGALRARVDEPVWRRLWSPAGEMTGPLEPLTAVADDGDLPAETRAAAGLACGPAPIRIDLATAAGARGVLASWGCTGDAAAGAVRALAAPTGEAMRRTPGVEISVCPPGRVVDELLRLFPPGSDHVEAELAEPVSVPVEAAALVPQVLADPVLLREWIRQNELGDVPLVLRALAERPPSARADLTMRLADGTVVVRTWLRCALGWVALGLDGDRAVHRLQGRSEMRGDLVTMLTGAYDRVLEGAGHG